MDEEISSIPAETADEAQVVSEVPAEAVVEETAAPTETPESI